MPRTFRLLVLTAACAASIAACSGSAPAASTTATDPAASATATATDPAATATATAAATADSSAATTRVSANDASSDELVAALTAAGVPNADRWAREIEEYRPYDTSDPTLAHLQDELAKYDPDPATLAAILSVLEP